MINSRSNKDHTDKSTKKEALGTLFFLGILWSDCQSKKIEILIKIDKYLRKINFCSKPEKIKYWTNQNLMLHINSNCKTEL